jgi:hypothetical protein
MLPYTCYAAPNAPPLWFPARYVTSQVPVTLNVATTLGLDVPISGTVAVAPSGTGELILTSFVYADDTLLVTPTGGQPGRIYTYEFLVTGLSGEVYPFRVQQATLKLLWSDEAQVAPVVGFGTPMSWTSAAPLEISATGLVGQGSSQASALQLPAYFNVCSSCPSPAGFMFNQAITNGTQNFQNQDPSNDAPLYPPVGGQIIANGASLGINEPLSVGASGGSVTGVTTTGLIWNVA